MTRMSELTRYFMRALNLVVQAVADKDGEWVRFEDVAPRIAELEAALKAERQRVVQLERGEFICQKCGLRKDAEFTPGDF